MIYEFTDRDRNKHYSLDYEDYVKWENIVDFVRNWKPMKKNVTNLEYYRTQYEARKAYDEMVGKVNGEATVPSFVSWLYEEHIEKEIKHGDVYVVYFDADSSNCSGWLDVDSHDTVCFAHFMKWASQFSSREEAIDAAEERLSRIYKLIDDIPVKDGNAYPYNGRDSYTQEDKDNDKKKYRYHILKIDTLSIANRNVA